jgi:hypothetical protein
MFTTLADMIAESRPTTNIRSPSPSSTRTLAIRKAINEACRVHRAPPILPMLIRPHAKYHLGAKKKD